MLKCNQCQHINGDEDLFCACCGTMLPKLVEPIKKAENTNPLIRRIEYFLEDGDFDKANEYCERVLDMEPENSSAYLYKLLVEFHCHSKDDLVLTTSDISNSKNYGKIIRFGNASDKDFIIATGEQIKAKLLNHHKTLISEVVDGKIVLNEDEYIDIICQQCGEALSFTKEQIETMNPLICPMCDAKILINSQ